MKKLAQTIIILFCFITLNAQQIYFNERYNMLEPNIWCAGKTVINVDDGYIIVGVGGLVPNDSRHQIIIMKIDTLGNKMWGKSFGNPMYEYYDGWPGSAKQFINDTYLIGGVKVYLEDTIFNRSLLMCLNNEWDTLWAKEYGNTVAPIDTSNMINNINICKNNDIVTVGSQYYYNGTTMIHLMRIRANGTLIWEKFFGNPVRKNKGFSVICTEDGGFAIGGNVYTAGLSYTSDPIVYKVDSLGNYQWNKNFGGPYCDNKATICKASNEFIIVGTCYADSMSGSDEAYRRINIIKIDLSGNVIWNKKFGNSLWGNYLMNILTLDDGSIVAVGSVHTGLSSPDFYGWIMKFTPDGDSLWYRNYLNSNIGNDHNYLYDIKSTQDGGFLACGPVILMSTGGQQVAWVLKLDSIGCPYENCDPTIDISEYVTYINQTIKVWPNPVGDKLYVLLPLIPHTGKQSAILHVYDIDGKKVIETCIPEGIETFTLDVSGLKKGIYILEMTDGNRKHAGVKFIKE